MLRQGSLQDRLKSRGTSLFQVDDDHDCGVYGDECDADDNCDDGDDDIHDIDED